MEIVIITLGLLIINFILLRKIDRLTTRVNKLENGK